MSCSDHLNLALDDEEGATLQHLQGHSITYRIAMGPQAGRKVLTVQTIPAWQEDDYGTDQLGRIGGFSLHAGVAVNTRERKKLERICRYISRPALSAGPIRADGYRYGQVCLNNSVSGWDYARVVRALGLHGQTGSTGAQTSDETNAISWSAGAEQSLPRKRDAAKCLQGKTHHR